MYNGLLKDKFDIEKYNKNANKEKTEKNGSGRWYDVIMIIAAIVFLVTGIIWNLWKYNWLAFVVGGLVCGIVALIGTKSEK